MVTGGILPPRCWFQLFRPFRGHAMSKPIRLLPIVALVPLLCGSMCNIPTVTTMDNTVVRIALADFVTNTAGASGLAVRPSDGALFTVNDNGIFGPLKAGDNLALLTPLGATNLADAGIFGSKPEGLSLAITNSGEFWI